MKDTIGLIFGPLAGTINSQLKGYGLRITEPHRSRLEKIREAINLLRIHRYMPDSVSDRAYKKLIKEVGELALPIRLRRKDKDGDE